MAQHKKTAGAAGIAAVCRELAAPLAEPLGLTLWDVRFVKEGADWFLRVVIDKDGGVSIDDCVALTHALNPVLDEADPIAQSYCLEVMSPGIERELTRPEHFTAFAGCAVTVKCYRPLENGVREWVGTLIACDDSTLTLETANGEQRQFSRKDIATVRAVDEWDKDSITEE